MSQMLQIRAWLVETDPEIHRLLVLDPRLTLEQLHTVLQIAFGWQNCHLHQFLEEDGRRYARPSTEDRDVIDERKVLLTDVFDSPEKRIGYEYDFGDSWMHAVEFEKMVESEAVEYPPTTFIEAGKGGFSGKKRAAMCIGGAMAGPSEDCGGIFGYYDILKLKRSKKAKKTADEKEMLAWPGDWDPDWFHLSPVNEHLGRVRVKKAFGG